MSISSTLSPITLADKDKLKGYENYASWKILMEAHSKPKGLHKYWDGKITVPGGYESANESADSEDENNPKTAKPATTTPAPPPSVKAPGPTPLHSTTPSELEYELRESVAMSSILINISDIYGSGINPNQKSHVAWKHLTNLYGRASDRARNMREEALSNCKLEESGKVAGEDGHIEKMRTLHQQANEAGAKINDSRFITKLLNSFPDSWDPVITPMYGKPDLNKVVMNLTTHAERLAIHEGKSSSKKTTQPPSDAVRALETTVLALQAELRSFRNGNKSGGTSNPDKAHLKCSNPGCGKTGHLIADCFQTGGGKAGQYPHWWKGKCTAQNVTANLATTSSTTLGDITPGTHYALSVLVDTAEIERLIAENMPSEERVQALAATEAPGSISLACIADSRCTAYFFKDREVFATYKLVSIIGQSSKLGTNFSVLGIGNVEINVVHNQKEHKLTFKDSLHAPDVTANLISISRMDQMGWDIVFGGGNISKS